MVLKKKVVYAKNVVKWEFVVWEFHCKIIIVYIIQVDSNFLINVSNSLWSVDCDNITILDL